MKMLATAQLPRPAGIPPIKDPVYAVLNCAVLYDTGHGLTDVTGHAVYCERDFAESVLTALEQKCIKYRWGLVHVGIYAPRMARHEDGTPILVNGHPRVSNHNGRAIDWKGLTLQTGQYMDVPALRAQSPAAYQEVIDYVTHMCRAAGVPQGKIEVVSESSWQHCGFFPV